MTEFDLGSHSRPVGSHLAEVQARVDAGLAWLYGYNHEAAEDCFARAAALDPTCAFAWLGIAYAVGPNYNRPWEIMSPDDRSYVITRANLALTSAKKAGAGGADRALLDAIACRYPESTDVEDIAPWSDRYAEAMRQVRRDHPDDLDIVALTVEALMMRTPWALWDISTGAPASGASTQEAQHLLETTFAACSDAWRHPGLLHMYIHLMEMSPTPEAALRHGDALCGLVPDSGHLEHMATHIDVLTGDYAACLTRNLRAADADKLYFDAAGGENFYTLYRLHNLHFACYAAVFLGQRQAAHAAADALRAELPDAVVRIYPDLFEAFLATAPHVHVRFGDWEAALAEPLPEDVELYPYTRATVLYARAVALANLGRSSEAEAALTTFLRAADDIPEERMLFNNSARDVLRIGEAMARGEVAFKAGRHEEGLAQLRLAVQRDDNLLYEEPWAWMIPARHALGALLCEAGAWDEAESVYRADLGLTPTLPRPCQHPQNVWALRGLDTCLKHRGETVERAHIQAQLARALARCDVAIPASCFCARAA